MSTCHPYRTIVYLRRSILSTDTLDFTNDAYKFSFYPQTISDWNRLPMHITELQSPQGCPCKPPYVQLNPQLHVNSFKWGTWVFYLLLSGIAVLYRVQYNLEKISTLDLEEEKKKVPIRRTMHYIPANDTRESVFRH